VDPFFQLDLRSQLFRGRSRSAMAESVRPHKRLKRCQPGKLEIERGGGGRNNSNSTAGGGSSELRIINPENLDRQDSFPVPNRSPRLSPRTSSSSSSSSSQASSPRPERSTSVNSLIFTSPRTSQRPPKERRAKAREARRGRIPKEPIRAGKQKRLRTALHEAILCGNEAALDEQLEELSIQEINACEEVGGYSALMSAAACEDPVQAFRFVDKLVERGAEIFTIDLDGFSALHWAAAMGNVDAMDRLIDAGADIDGESDNGDTALHRASRFGRHDCLKSLISVYGADLHVCNKEGKTALEVAGQFCSNKALVQKVRQASRNAFFAADERLKTVILYHGDCLRHRTATVHQEAPERVSTILEKIKSNIDPSCLHISSNFPKASRTQLEYAHESKYIDFVHELHGKVSTGGDPVPFTPRVQAMHGIAENKVKDEMGCDTFFSSGSLPAALRAVGAVCGAVDRVVSGRNRNAFCIIRPPGHHAGVNGLLDNAISCGFCIFNNVAIAAMHALKRHKDVVQRVAIVDFDVHHGNGTEEILRKKFRRPDQVFFFSVHLFDKGNPSIGSAEFYPGSGEADVPDSNVMNAPLLPLWRIAANRTRSNTRKSAIAAASLVEAVTAEQAVPGSDSSVTSKSSSYGEEETGGTSSSSSAFPDLQKLGREAFRHNVKERLIPNLFAFNPDLIFISAGFDAGKNDIGCSRNENGKYCTGIDLVPEDYRWITNEILAVAGKCCEGRVVSALEGGYGQWVRAKRIIPGESTKKLTMNRENLAENALAHANALVDR